MIQLSLHFIHYSKMLALARLSSIKLAQSLSVSLFCFHFIVQPFVKGFTLCYRTVVLSVCDIGVLWPNGWMDHDATWCGGRPQLRPHCVRWGPSSLQKGIQQPSSHFSVHVYCDEMAGWIKMPLCMEVGLSSGHVVLNGDPAPPESQKGI